MSRITMRLAATAAACGAVLAAAALPAAAASHARPHHPFPVSHRAPAPQRAEVVLGAVQHDSRIRGNSVRALDAEWIAVTNTGRSAVDLAGWTLSDSDHHTYRFHHLWLGGHQSVRVHTGFGRDTSRDVYQGSRRSLWDARDTATLRDARGHVVDTESWGHGWGGRR
ncbi:lamin tail domain-containing protein [Actinacidiphila guanduensis]|uniref:lamin tail domain-containing protein n=1 Tax=Actinacidiphila guanduensis TaxID=310781 RepID=UPI001FEBC962|nr:lamin tail domain-containing protein [Actinacidiphila guanduensis]